MTDTRASPPQRVWGRLRRPAGLLEQTRWLFCLCVVGCLLLSVPASLPGSTAWSLGLEALAAAGLIASWLGRYLTRSAPLVLDLLDGALLTAFALGASNPGPSLTVAFSALWFRSLYGPTSRVALHCLLSAAGLVAALPLWGLVPGHAPSTPGAPVLGSLAVLFATMAVARYLGIALIAREQAQHRDAALSELGNELLATTGADAILERAWGTARALCAATPGMRLLVTQGDSEHPRVVGHAGEFVQLPLTLTPLLLPRVRLAGDVHRLVDDPGLTAAAGFRGRWVCFSLPEQLNGWAVLGAPGGVPDDAVVAVRSMLSQLALAQRNSDAREDLTAQARTDGLTGLANRATFAEALEVALHDSAAGVAVLFVDLDDFKTVNDGLGHAAGDELLRVVAARMVEAVRPDDLCARLGGDEFAVLLRGAPGGIAPGVAQRLVDVIAEPVTVAGRLTQIAASVGLASASGDSTTEQLVHRADIAMYAAKAGGKNRLQAFDMSLLRADPTAVFEAELDAAADAGQIVVYYQPIVSVVTGHCTAVEALVRWRHPTRGLLGPDEFVRAAERTGAIVAIGALVLHRACADAVSWPPDNGRPLRVHVNVSAVQLTTPGYVDRVRACITEFAMAPKQLVLEITESMVMESAPIRATLDALVRAGAALAIDDFGTGYSALTTLRTLPLDIVKIDRSFVAGCPANTADRAVVEAIVQMAERLGLQTVAEGVERPEQEQFVRAVGADGIQGYLHLRPTTDAALNEWLRAQPAAAAPRETSNVVPLTPRRTG